MSAKRSKDAEVLQAPKYRTLEKITAVTAQIAEAETLVEKLHNKRYDLYELGMSQGATLVQLGDAAGLSHQGVKYKLAQMRKQK